MENNNIQTFKSSSYNVMDANKTFFYVILTNILSPIVFYVLMLFLLMPLSKALPYGVYNTIYTILLSALMTVLYIFVILIFHKKKKFNLKSSLKLNQKLNPLIILLIVAISVVCIACFFPLINMLYVLVEKMGFNMSGTLAFEMTNWWRLFVGIVIFCLLPAIVEEIIFRGIILNGWLKRAKPYVAIILSATAFFIMHGSIQQSFYQIILGVILSLIGYYCGNIIYPIIFHFLNNLFVVLLSYFNVGGYLNGFSFTVGGVFASIGLFLLGVAIIFGVFCLIRKLTSKNRVDNYEFEEGTNNIIITDGSEKLGFKAFIRSHVLDEKFYFVGAWVIAIIMWIFNSL